VAFDMTNVNNLIGISCVDTNHVRVEDCTAEGAAGAPYFIVSTHPVFDDVSWYRITNNLTRNTGLCDLNRTGSGNCNNNVVMGNVGFGWSASQFYIQMQTAQRSHVLWNNLESNNCPGIRWYGSSHYNHTFFNGGEQNVTPFLQYDDGAWGNVHFNFGTGTSTVLVNDLDGANSAAAGSQSLQRNTLSVSTKTASYILDGIGGSFFGTLFDMNVATANTFTIGSQASEGVQVGAHVKVRQLGAGQTTMVPGGGVTLRSATGLKTRVQYSVIEAQKVAANEWAIWGDTTT
jgi:hypothetical protein